jgi:recombination protein RecA
MKASESPYNTIEYIETPFPSLNKILGGGIPLRRITEVSGNYSVGKSTFALHCIAAAQKAGRPCYWADTEFQYTLDYSKALGVDNDELELLQERFAETTLDAIEVWAEENKNALIVLDSVGSLLVRQEAEKDASGKVIGGQAKLIATFCRKMVPILAINNNALLVLNHQLIDLMSGKLKTSGGAKLEYAKSIWLSLRKANKRVMSGDTQVGDIIEAEIRKNKLSATKTQKCELTLIYGSGFSAEADTMQDALDKGIITKEGQFYFMDGVKIARGANGLREALKDEGLLSKVVAAMG